MQFSRYILAITIVLFLCSCQNGVEKKRETDSKKKEIPSIEKHDTKKSLPELKQPKRIDTPSEKQVKKKKLKAMDTLKPVKAIP